MKTILKVFYIALGLVIAIIVGVSSYYSYTYDYIKELASGAISSKSYTDIPWTFGSWFDTESIAPAEDSDKFDITIHPACVVDSYSWYVTDGETETTKTNQYFENGYYIYIFNPSFDMDNCSTGTTTYNKTGLRFYASDSEYYDYYYTVSSSVNSNTYIEKPATLDEARLHAEREAASTYSTWGFIDISISEGLIKAMNLSSSVNKIALIDNSGALIYTLDVNLDFSQSYFNDMTEFISKYNSYVDAYAVDSSSANTAFSEFYDGEDGFLANYKKTETHGYNTYSQPSVIVWKAIGTAALFVVAAFMLYMVIFHLKWLKGLFIKENRNSGRYAVSNKAIAEYEAKKQAQTVDAQYTEKPLNEGSEKALETEVETSEEKSE